MIVKMNYISLNCHYSKRLVTKLLQINNEKMLYEQIDIHLIKKAIYFAKKYHNDQKRQSGEPFYVHPLEVAYMVSDCIVKTDIIVTAILLK